jgi:uridine kinase
MTKDVDDYAALLSFIRTKHKGSSGSRFLIAIGGYSRGGKTTVTRRLLEDFEKEGVHGTRISLDNWLLGVDQRTEQMTVRDRYQCQEIVKAITLLRDGGEVYHPVYDAKTRSIVAPRSKYPLRIPNHGVGVIEGVIALDIEQLRALCDVRVFVEISDEVRRSRLERFYIQFKGCSPEETTRIINEREREEIPIIKASMQYADVVYHPAGNEVF